MDHLKSPIVSVFSAIQGEGLYVGRPHLFIRLAGCNLRCPYCDTREAWTIPEYGRIETEPFANIFRNQCNPMGIGYLVQAVKRLAGRFPHYHAIALTGGEPLLQAEFLKACLPHLRRLRIPILLETNGTLPEQLKKVINLVDIISMDIKIPSQIKGSTGIWKSARLFLRLANNKKADTYIKIIMNQSASRADYQKAARLAANINKNIPVVLQPVSAVRQNIKTPSLNRIIETHKIFTEELTDVRIIPQIHRIMGWK